MEEDWGLVAAGLDEELYQQFDNFQREEGEEYKSIIDFCDEFDQLAIQGLSFNYQYVFYFVPSLPRTKKWRQVKKLNLGRSKNGCKVESFIDPVTGRLTYMVYAPGNSSSEALRDSKEQIEDYFANNSLEMCKM
jgi:hypothetical protein